MTTEATQILTIDRKPVVSSNLLSIGYDAATQTLDVEFNTGRVYRYSNVPQAAYDAFIGAESIGRHFAKHIRGAFQGVNLEQFDGDKSVAGIQRKVLDMRKRRVVGREEARFIWTEIDDRSHVLTDGEQSFITACGEIRRECEQPWSPRTLSRIDMDELATIFEEPWYEIQKRDDPAAVGFWRDLWPPFIAALEAELQPETEGA